MNLVLDYEQYNINNIFFYEAVKNTIMEGSSFIRIVYSNEDLVLNGIYIKIELQKHTYSRKLQKSAVYNDTVLAFVEKLETDILNKYNENKAKVKKIKDHISFLINKINYSVNGNDSNYLLKISGIWETSNTMGLTFKFIYIAPK